MKSNTVVLASAGKLFNTLNMVWSSITKCFNYNWAIFKFYDNYILNRGAWLGYVNPPLFFVGVAPWKAIHPYPTKVREVRVILLAPFATIVQRNLNFCGYINPILILVRIDPRNIIEPHPPLYCIA